MVITRSGGEGPTWDLGKMCGDGDRSRIAMDHYSAAGSAVWSDIE